jgi:hypothetical protein
MEHLAPDADWLRQGNPMKLFLQSSMIFFGTLLAAALVALGEPATAEVQMVGAAPAYDTVLVGLLGLEQTGR